MSRSQHHWDTSYEWKAVTLLGLGFGLVGLDRWIIAPLFPCMAATGVAPGCGAPGLGLEPRARRGQRDASGGALEESCAESVYQPSDAVAEGRRRQGNATSGRAKARARRRADETMKRL